MLYVNYHKSASWLSVCLVLLMWFLYREALLHPSFVNNKAKFESIHDEASQLNEQPWLINMTRHRYELMDEYAQETVETTNSTFKWILLWNKYPDGRDFRIGAGHHRLRDSGCPVWQCETTLDRTKIRQADAVVFHLRSWRKNDLPKQRSPHQRYIFWSRESPVWRHRLYDTELMAHFFNWTMTYRWDSDVVGPYGYVKPIANVPLHPSDDHMKLFLSNPTGVVNYAEGKTKMAAWLVSNCNAKSSRKEMVTKLQQYVDVDVYGKCGTMSCSKDQAKVCKELATKKYKFYMALENSLCLDYVTEKFFDTLQYPVIPVVFGYHDNYEKIAPRHSFINAAKFENVKQLADYLMLLDKNDTLYNQYFWWKPYFKVRDSTDDQALGFCHLCAALHNKTLIPKVYHNLTTWWDTESKCAISPRIV
ncbi:hypothetical protein GHT06_015941 [Daphnia sinensis]|uniref:Fucosyltransferase n=1 Tax=Daphnia sinensis TaxID=1820382 RepID=A0AAD5KRV4_9CRUS|nr:hypothetical protein GHT06_015941 [Daphnia sinensis]